MVTDPHTPPAGFVRLRTGRWDELATRIRGYSYADNAVDGPPAAFRTEMPPSFAGFDGSGFRITATCPPPRGA